MMNVVSNNVNMIVRFNSPKYGRIIINGIADQEVEMAGNFSGGTAMLVLGLLGLLGAQSDSSSSFATSAEVLSRCT
jgi:hypothetical protein